MSGAITDISGIKVGHASDFEGITGCTVILCEQGAVAGVDQRGGGPGTREIALLNPVNNVEKVHAIVLAGGSAFGLDAASGVMRYLEEKQIGYQTGVARVPIVPSAILFDLGIGEPNTRPDAAMGYQACQNATTQPPEQGSIGAGTGATVGKLLGTQQGIKSGIGTASIDIGGGVTVGAIVAVNAVGDIIDPNTGKIIAGARPIKKGPIKIGGEGFFADSLSLMGSMVGRSLFSLADRANTVISVVATNASFDKAGATKIAQMAQNGVVRCVRPANTMHDGDTMFALSLGKKKANINIVGAFAAQAVQMAILNAIAHAKGLGGIPAITDFEID
ncbi:P1 family peptidase [bacterium]|nr:P1 family peptidase [bacterium]